MRRVLLSDLKRAQNVKVHTWVMIERLCSLQAKIYWNEKEL